MILLLVLFTPSFMVGGVQATPIWCWGKDPKSFSAACVVHTAVSRDRNPTTHMFFREQK